MSLPSVSTVLVSKGLSLDTATEDQLQSVIIEAVQEDLPVGYANIERMVNELHQGASRRVRYTLDPISEAGKQFIRLLASDAVRRVLERHFRVRLGFYNCCTGIVVRENGVLKMTLREQVALQSPDSLDC